jgi:nickel/cobalt transporter (NicO) family protein
MIEGIPVFFASRGYGAELIALMAMVFAATTIATYVVLCHFPTSYERRSENRPQNAA